MLALAPLLVTAAAAGFVSANPDAQPRSSHNANNHHRRQFKREITNDASTVNGKTFDFIIAGGGLAGLAVAGRLSEWSNQTVLVIEAGGDGSGTLADGRVIEDMIDIPGNSYLHGLPGSSWDWQYKTVAQTSAANTIKNWPRGKGLGGSGAVNGMYWNRGNRENYEAWKTLNPDADEDWGWDEVNRCIMKAENWTAARPDQVSQHAMNLDPSAHGTEGAIQAGFSEYMFDIVENWTPSLEAVGMAAIDGGSGTTHGSYFCPLTLNPSNMTRSDSKAGYIDPLPPRDNLVILTGQQVTQITFNGTNDADGNILASGVTFQAAAGGQTYTVNANREVILSGGTVGSPQILQLSGIGPAAQLATAGVQSRLDLPVGYNLQDHITVAMSFSTPDGTLTWNNLSNDATLAASEMTKYENDRTGMWTFVNEAVAFPNMADLLGGPSADYAATVLSQLNATWAETVANKDLPDNVARGLSSQYIVQQAHIDSDVGQVEMLLHLLGPNNNIAIQASVQHPWSRGTIFINSADAFTSPTINPDYFSVGYDIDVMDKALGFARRIAAAAPMNTLAIAETQPGVAATAGSDTMYDYIRRTGVTTYHPIGTCSMLPRDQGGVVDTRLLVYGTGNIRVVDSSIIPLHMSAHTMGTTYGVAEKAAEIIKRRYYEVPEVTSTSDAGASATGSESEKSTGTAAVAGNNNLNANAGMSNAAKIGVGIGAGVGAFALLAALLAFCCIRRKKKQAPKDAAWFQGGQEYNQVPKEGGEYPMANFTPPHAAYAMHGRTPSVSTMATTELATRDPMMASRRASSGFGFDGYNYDSGDIGGSGAVTPNERFDEGGYPSQPPSGAWSPAHQKYTQVNI